MWILEVPEAPSHKFRFKQLSLSPGTQLILGRGADCPVHGEWDKTVSRSNTQIVVADAVQGSYAQLDARSDVTITDDSRFGTLINDVHYSKKENASCVLTEASNMIRIGKFELDFKLFWRPMVLCIVKGAFKHDEEAEIFRKCDAMNIKASHNITDKTTHVICKTVNTFRGLQALIRGLPIVSPAYISAIYDAREMLQNDMSHLPDVRSPDFFPTEMPGRHDPKLCLPLAPNSTEAKARAQVFEGLEFIFACKSAYDKISPVITEGCGKCLLYDGARDLEALAAFVQKCKKPVWVIPKDDTKGSLVLQVATRTCTEHIFQDDLLDIILSNGTHNIFRACPATRLMEPIMSSQLGVPLSGMPLPPNLPASSQIPAPSQPLLSSQIMPPPLSQETSAEMASPARKRVRTNAFQKSMAAMKPTMTTATHRSFGAGIQIPKPRASATPTNESLVMPSLSRAGSSQLPQQVFKTPVKQTSLDNFFSQSRVPHRQVPALSTETSRADESRSQRMLAPTEEIQEVVEEAPIYAPAAQAFAKKRAAQSSQSSIVEAPPVETRISKKDDRGTKRKAKEVMSQITEDEVVRELETQKDKIDKKAADEAQEAAADDEDYLAPPAPVVTFQVKKMPKANPVAAAHRGYWDPRWNGRPNFKLFQPKGHAQTDPDMNGNYGLLKVQVLLVKDTARPDSVGMRDLEWLERETREDEPPAQVASSKNKRSTGTSSRKKADPLAFAFDFDGAEAAQEEERSNSEEPARNGDLFIADSDDEVHQYGKNQRMSDSDDMQMLEDDEFASGTATMRATPATRNGRKTRSTASDSQSLAKTGSRAPATIQKATRASTRKTSPAASRRSQTQLVQESIVLSSDDDEPIDKLKFRF